MSIKGTVSLHYLNIRKPHSYFIPFTKAFGGTSNSANRVLSFSNSFSLGIFFFFFPDGNKVSKFLL